MHLVLSILSAGVIVSSLVPNQPGFGQGVDGITGENFKSETVQLTDSDNENPINLSKHEKIPRKIFIEEDADDIEDMDFDGDEFEDEDFKELLGTGSVTSLMHVHHEEGEILVPCFGMWWPVGGYNTGGGYEYIDYYGDYRRKKRRSKKQKKAAKMKKKRS